MCVEKNISRAFVEWARGGEGGGRAGALEMGVEMGMGCGGWCIWLVALTVDRGVNVACSCFLVFSFVLFGRKERGGIFRLGGMRF